MAKKTFKDNPALQFISSAEEEQTTTDQQPKKAPREAFTPPEGYRINPSYLEIKSRRLQLLLPPSLHEKIKGRAEKLGMSVNECINRILEEATREE